MRCHTVITVTFFIYTHTIKHTHTHTPVRLYPFLQTLRYPSPFLCVNIMNVYTQRAVNINIITSAGTRNDIFTIHTVYPVVTPSSLHNNANTRDTVKEKYGSSQRMPSTTCARCQCTHRHAAVSDGISGTP